MLKSMQRLTFMSPQEGVRSPRYHCGKAVCSQGDLWLGIPPGLRGEDVGPRNNVCTGPGRNGHHRYSAGILQV